MLENSLLPLQPDVVGSFGRVGEVPSGLEVLPAAKILGLFSNGIDAFLASCCFRVAGAGAPFVSFAVLPFGILDGWRKEKEIIF